MNGSSLICSLRKEVEMARKFMLFILLTLVTVPALAHVDTAWVRRYDGEAGADDIAIDVAVGNSDTVYVTGRSYRTLLNRDFATIKYDPDGDSVWVNLYNGPYDGFDDAYDVTVDLYGYVYVTGESAGDAGQMPGDWATLKYKPDGDTVWTRRWHVADERAYAIAVDGDGNVYVTGGCRETTSDLWTAKYSATGDSLWMTGYDGPEEQSEDRPAHRAMVTDDSGYIYVTGQCNGLSGAGGEPARGDYVTVKYRPNGEIAWTKTYSGPGDSIDFATDIALDGSGNIYVTGYSFGNGTGKDYATIKYRPSGDTAWLRRHNGPGDGDDAAHAIAVDGSYNVYVTGNHYDPRKRNDYATIKYDSGGTPLWTKTYHAGEDDRANDIVVDGGGNVYVTGTSYSNQTDYDYATIRYNPDGTEAWVERYDGPAGGEDFAEAIALEDSNHIHVTGWSDGGFDYDYATINYVQFLCGDASGNGQIDQGDIVYLLNYLYQQGSPPDPIQAGDCNMDGIVDQGDVVYLLNYLYYEGPAPCDVD